MQGLLKTTDGGVTWQKMGGTTLNNLTIRSIAATSILDPGTNKQIIMVAPTNGVGLFRSKDAGVTFTNISTGAAGQLPAGAVSQIVGDPGNASRFYVGIPTKGVYITTDAGATWTQVNTGLTGVAASGRLELSVSAAAGNPVYVGIIAGGQLTGVFRSPDQGANWTQMDTPITNENGTNEGLFPGEEEEGFDIGDDDVEEFDPGGQGGNNFAILADNSDPNVVFVSGDRQPSQVNGSGKETGVFPNSIGAPDYTGRTFRGDASQPAGSQFVDIDANNANNTSPHADSRDMQFDANGNILQANDGGLYRLTNPNSGSRTWSAVIGNLRDTEFYSIGYDSVNDTILGGTQDTGVPQQTAAGSMTWSDVTKGDGGIVAVDNTSSPGNSIHYYSNNLLAGFTRETYDNSNNLINTTGITLLVNGAGSDNLKRVEGNVAGGSTLQFVNPYVLNAVDPTRMLIGTNYLYESTNQGANLTSLGGIQNLNSDGIDNDGDGITDDGTEYAPINSLGSTTALVYGGVTNSVNNVDFALVGTTGSGGNFLFVRITNSTNAIADFAPLIAYPGVTPRSIAVNPSDYNEFFVLDQNNRIFETTDLGVTFANITANLALLVGLDLRTLEFFQQAGANNALLAGGYGGVYRDVLTAAPLWSQYGADMPAVVVKDLQYNADDDVLVAGTWGRGVWTISSVSTTINASGVLEICGDEDYPNENDTIKLVLDPVNPLLLDVFLNNTTTVPTLQVPMAVLSQINIFAAGGNDTLIVDSSNGLISVPNGIKYDGDHGCPDQDDAGIGGFDSLILTQDVTSGPTISGDLLAPGATPGSGRSTISDSGGNIQLIDFQYLEPITDSVPSPTYNIASVPGLASVLDSANAINYTAGSSAGFGRVTVDNFEPIEFSNKDSLIIAAGAGSDEINLNNPHGADWFHARRIEEYHHQRRRSNGQRSPDRQRHVGNDTVAFAPGGLDSATITGAGPVPITALLIEHVTYSGQGGTDALTYTTPVVTGNAQAQVAFTPGATSNSGSIVGTSTANGQSLLPFDFRNIGGNGTLTFATADSSRNIFLEVYGTAANDQITVNSNVGSGQITSTEVATIVADTCASMAPACRASHFTGWMAETISLKARPRHFRFNDDDRRTMARKRAVDVFIPNAASAAPLLSDTAGQNSGTGVTVIGYGGTIDLVAPVPSTATLGVNNNPLTVNVTAARYDFTPALPRRGSFIANTTGPVAATRSHIHVSRVSPATGITDTGSGGFDVLGLIGTNGNDSINAVQDRCHASELHAKCIHQGLPVGTAIFEAPIRALSGDDLIRDQRGRCAGNHQLRRRVAIRRRRRPAQRQRPLDRQRRRPGRFDSVAASQRSATAARSRSVCLRRSFTTTSNASISRRSIPSPAAPAPTRPAASRSSTPIRTNTTTRCPTPPNCSASAPIPPARTSIRAASPPRRSIHVPGDDDWYVVPSASHRHVPGRRFCSPRWPRLSNGRPGLPGTGDFDLDIYDANGVLITSGIANPRRQWQSRHLRRHQRSELLANFNTIYVRVHGHTRRLDQHLRLQQHRRPDHRPARRQRRRSRRPASHRRAHLRSQHAAQRHRRRKSELQPVRPQAGQRAAGPHAAGQRHHDQLQRSAGPLPRLPVSGDRLHAHRRPGPRPVLGGRRRQRHRGHQGSPHSQRSGFARTRFPPAKSKSSSSKPLPDDRFTLTISDSLRDPAQNRLDGESNASEPNNGPFFPSGDGHSGGDFVARFTVDTRPGTGRLCRGPRVHRYQRQQHLRSAEPRLHQPRSDLHHAVGSHARRPRSTGRARQRVRRQLRGRSRRRRRLLEARPVRHRSGGRRRLPLAVGYRRQRHRRSALAASHRLHHVRSKRRRR